MKQPGRLGALVLVTVAFLRDRKGLVDEGLYTPAGHHKKGEIKKERKKEVEAGNSVVQYVP